MSSEIEELDRQLDDILKLPADEERASESNVEVDATEPDPDAQKAEAMAVLDAKIAALTLETNENIQKIDREKGRLGILHKSGGLYKWSTAYNLVYQLKLGYKQKLEQILALQNQSIAVPDEEVTQRLEQGYKVC